jgi:hypothetical protein
MKVSGKVMTKSLYIRIYLDITVVREMKMNIGEVCGILASIVSVVGIVVNAMPIVTGLVGLLLGLGIFGVAREAAQIAQRK